MNEDTKTMLVGFALEQYQRGFDMLSMTKKYKRKQLDEKKPEVEVFVSCFLECLEHASEPMFLRDITAVVVARVRMTMNFPLFTGIFNEGGRMSEHILHQEWAIHQWLVKLQNDGLLDGTYDEYIGKFFPK